ncbi:unnamed protein product [Lampetra planeri]
MDKSLPQSKGVEDFEGNQVTEDLLAEQSHQPNNQTVCFDVLKDVVAYVDVWSSSHKDNYTWAFSKQLLMMGATVSRRFTKNVTHVIFKDGLESTWSKAMRTGVKLVSVLWVDNCLKSQKYLDEALYPVRCDPRTTPDYCNKKRRWRRPLCVYDLEDEDSRDKRLQKKLQKLTQQLDNQKTATVGPDCLILAFDDEGQPVFSPMVTRSPVLDRVKSMADRLQEMKARHENISLTGTLVCISGEHQTSTGNCKNSSELSSFDLADVLPVPLCTDTETQSSSTNIGSLTDTVSKTSSNSLDKYTCGGRNSSDDILVTGEVRMETATSERHKATRLIGENVAAHEEDIMVESDLAPIVNCNSAGGTGFHSEQSAATSAVFETSRKRPHADYTRTPGSARSRKKQKLQQVPESPSCISPFDDYFLPENVQELAPRNQDVIKRVSALFGTPKTNTNSRRESQDGSKITGSSIVSLDGPTRTSSNPQQQRIDEEPQMKPQTKTTRGSRLRRRAPSLGECGRPAQRSVECAPHGHKYRTVTSGTLFTDQILPCPDYRLFTSWEDLRDFPGQQLPQNDDFLGKPEQVAPLFVSRVSDLSCRGCVHRQRSRVHRVVRKLGGFELGEDVQESTTHVVLGSPRRTLNALLGIARGCWLLSLAWVLESAECGHWLEEEPYEMTDTFPAAQLHLHLIENPQWHGAIRCRHVGEVWKVLVCSSWLSAFPT